MTGVNLTGANFSNNDVDTGTLDLSGADLSDADLRGAILADADLRGAKLTLADLSSADLTGAKITGADFWGANLESACWPQDAVVPEGWKRDPDSARLEWASNDSGSAEANEASGEVPP
jgi:hypothetical protein